MNLHKHHIVPIHAGGTNERSNIIRLSVAEHAEAHRQLYEQYGRIQDKIAWLGLSGRTAEREAAWLEYLRQPKSDAVKEKLRLAATGKKHSAETRAKMRASHMGNKNAQGHIQTAEHKAKNAAAQRGNTRALGNHFKHTEEAKQKIREARLSRHVTPSLSL